jgi:hypothetical protein
MHRSTPSRLVLSLLVAGLLLSSAARGTELIQDPDIERTWLRLDQPVALGAVKRTWFWGPNPLTGLIQEPYHDAPGGQRKVIYLDKTRMEINETEAVGSTWRVR